MLKVHIGSPFRLADVDCERGISYIAGCVRRIVRPSASRTLCRGGSAPLYAANWAFLKARRVSALGTASAADVHRHAAARH
jgi:hypothetical protein